MFTGRAPMAQPPGNETSALPKRARSGPSTRIEARIVRTSSYGATCSRIVPASTSTRILSSIVTLTPMRPSSSIMVVTSCKCGTLPTDTVPCASSVAARIGSAAFFAPEMRTSPSSGTPPWICSLSTGVRFLWRQHLHRQGVDLAAHARAQRAVDQLMALQGALALELRGDDHRFEMRVVRRADAHLCAGQAGLDQRLNFGSVHVSSSTEGAAILAQRAMIRGMQSRPRSAALDPDQLL